MSDKQRIIDLQKQVRIARIALEAVKYGRDPYTIADEALDAMMALDPAVKRAPLEGVLGWGKKRR